MKFIKEAFSELDHVVWPTSKESKKYMSYTAWTIIVMTLFLTALGFLFRETFAFARGQVHSVFGIETQQVIPNNQQENIDDLIRQMNASGAIQANVTASGVNVTTSGATITTESQNTESTGATAENNEEKPSNS